MGNNAELNIPAFRLCSEVTGFGDYAEYKDLTFVRSRPIQMIGYIEVENSDPKITAEGQHKTTLKVELELYTDSDSTIVWNQPAQTVVDICNTKRQDFFVVYRINLPPNLNVGTYYLKARVRDEESGEEAESIQTITVVARK